MYRVTKVRNLTDFSLPAVEAKRWWNNFKEQKEKKMTKYNPTLASTLFQHEGKINNFFQRDKNWDDRSLAIQKVIKELILAEGERYQKKAQICRKKSPHSFALIGLYS